MASLHGEGDAEVYNSETNGLPRLLCLAVGAPVTVSKTPQLAVVGFTNNNNAGATIVHVMFDPSEAYLLRGRYKGYRPVALYFPPVWVRAVGTWLPSGLQPEGLLRGIIACGPIQTNFLRRRHQQVEVHGRTGTAS